MTRRVLMFIISCALLWPVAAQAQGRSRSLWLTGLALSSAGGVVSVVGAYAMRDLTCETFFIGRDEYFTCEKGPNKPVLFTGVGMAAAGTIMMAVGARNAVTFGPRRVTFIHRW